jgi:hypothetical protein
VNVTNLYDGSVEFLLSVYDDERAVFPYSTTVTDGAYVNDFDNPLALRYTINSLLGLARAGALEVEGLSESTRRRIARFMSTRYGDVAEPADLGLLLLLLAETGIEPTGAADIVDRLDAIAKHREGSLNMQDAAWMLWGASIAVRNGLDRAEAVAHNLYELVDRRFVDRRSGLARHRASGYRRDLVSFGSTVYFLRSVFEFARTFDAPSAEETFARGVQAIVRLQGPQGEWPWLISVSNGTIVEPYPFFAVHQDSMAMLFLLPAVDNGLDVRNAIDRSFAWTLGDNELGIEMTSAPPFVAYRSIERRDVFPRAMRFGRCVASRTLRRRPPFGAGRVRLNPECRSYHLGWVLYAWSGRSDAPWKSTRYSGRAVVPSG